MSGTNVSAVSSRMARSVRFRENSTVNAKGKSGTSIESTKTKYTSSGISKLEESPSLKTDGSEESPSLKTDGSEESSKPKIFQILGLIGQTLAFVCLTALPVVLLFLLL